MSNTDDELLQFIEYMKSVVFLITFLSHKGFSNGKKKFELRGGSNIEEDVEFLMPYIAIY